MPDPTTYDWTPGTTRLHADHDQPSLLLIHDGAGVYCGMLRVGSSTLQFTTDPPDKPRAHRTWRDATEIWAAFPPWLRRQATDALSLDPKF